MSTVSPLWRKKCFGQVEHCLQFFFSNFCRFFQNHQSFTLPKSADGFSSDFRKKRREAISDICDNLGYLCDYSKKNEYKIFLNDLQYLAL